MKPFLHHDRKQLVKFLNEVADLGLAYRSRVFGAEDRLSNWLATLEEYFSQKPSGAAKVAEIARLRNYLETANRGVHPVLLQKLNKGRREMQATAIFSVLNETTVLLVAYHEKIEASLEEAQELLEQILLSALHEDIIDGLSINTAASSPRESEVLWTVLWAHPDLQLSCQRVLLSVSTQDVHLLLYSLVNRIRGEVFTPNSKK